MPLAVGRFVVASVRERGRRCPMLDGIDFGEDLGMMCDDAAGRWRAGPDGVREMDRRGCARFSPGSWPVCTLRPPCPTAVFRADTSWMWPSSHPGTRCEGST